MDPRFKTPFTMLISGGSGCDKTTFVERLIQHLQVMMTEQPEEIIWCYNQWQDTYTRLSNYNVIFREGLPNEWYTGPPRLVIIDDLMCETDKRMIDLFTVGSHHKNISVIFIVQNLFEKSLRTISLNAHYLVIFKNPRDTSQIMHLAKQIFPGQSNYMQAAYKDATSEPHSYLLVDLKQDTPENARLRTSIFPGETQVVYVPK